MTATEEAILDSLHTAQGNLTRALVALSEIDGALSARERLTFRAMAQACEGIVRSIRTVLKAQAESHNAKQV